MGYESLESMVDALKKAAVDAWMRDNDWYKRGDDYVTTYQAEDIEILYASEYIPERPGEIHQVIEEIVNPWRLLPDPADIAELVEVCSVIANRLAVSPDLENGVAQGGKGEDNISVNIMLINQSLTAMSGAMISKFKSRVLASMGITVAGLHSISIVRGLNAARQQAMWEAAESDLVEAISAATRAMNAIAGRSSIDWKQVLTVTDWLLKGLSLFEVPGAGKAADAVDLAIEITDDFGQDDDHSDNDCSPKSYDEAIAGLRRCLDEINNGIRHSETLIDENLVENLRCIRRDKSSYDMTQTPVYSVMTDEGEVGVQIVNPGLIGDIYRDYMPVIAGELDSAAKDVDDSSRHILVLRDDSIGIGAEGPSRNFSDLNWLLYDLLKNMADEVGYAAKNLELAVEELVLNNEETAEALRRAADDFAGGSAYDPWK
jgi:hypothetical protein